MEEMEAMVESTDMTMMTLILDQLPQVLHQELEGGDALIPMV